jgi:ABC-type oligopeptide transport system substrate-binding subunit
MVAEINQGRYLLEAELGRGGMGVVYRTRDTLLDRMVAVKLVSAGTLGGEAQERLMQEARAAARLNHPNVVSVYDVGQEQLPGESGFASYIVMELVDGKSLREHQTQSLDEAIAIGRQVCSALEQAHKRGIIHRDLKPENVLLAHTPGEEPPLRAKLVDFGLARVTGRSRLTQAGALVGTLSYMAPEVILGEDAVQQSDLYALGVMLYEMAAGRPPFEGGTATAILSQHLHAPIVPPSAFNDRIPPYLDQLIVQLLGKDPDRRPASAAAVRQQLRTAAPGEAAVGSGPDELRTKRLVRGRLIGREAEFSKATALWEKTATGEGHVLLVSGESGIGKTRLVQELVTHAEIRGAMVSGGVCYERGALPYMPISQIIRAALATDQARELAPEIVAGVEALAKDGAVAGTGSAVSPDLDPEHALARLMENIVAFFRALAMRQRAAESEYRSTSALLLFIDDLHWADSGTLAVVRHLARRLGDQPILIVGTFREVDLDGGHPLPHLLADLQREQLVTRIKLRRLTKEQVGQLLMILFSEEVTPEFLEGIYRETEGNPFFVEEICRVLVESGELSFKDGHWQRPEMAHMRLPQSIRAAIQPRIGKLSAQEREALTLAALLGRDFRYEMLRTVSDLDDTDLIRALESAERFELIHEVPFTPARTDSGSDPLFSFTHALIHSTLLSELSTLRRRQMQHSVATKLDEAYPERGDELAPLLGRYFAEAHDVDKAIAYLLRTGDQARESFAFDEAITSYTQALSFLREENDGALTARTLMKLAMVYHNTFNFRGARVAFEEAFVAWQRASEEQQALKAEHEQAPHPLRINFANPLTLDATRSVDAFSGAMVDQLFSGLLQINVEGEIVPDLAVSWEVFDGGRRYLFQLRNDARWTDGWPVTANDFEFAWKRTLNGPSGEQPATYLYDIKGARAFNEGRAPLDSVAVRARGDWVLEVELERPTSYFLELMAGAVTRPVPAHAVRALGDAWAENDNLVTNGPFRLATWQKGKRLTLERNPDYHGHFGGNIDRVEIYFDLATSENLVHKYDANELDVYYPNFAVSSAYGWARYRHPAEYMSIPALGTYYLGFNVTRWPFKDRRVRRAFALAIDRENLADENLKGIDFPATGGLSPPGMFGHVSDAGSKYDPYAARVLMAEAGYKGGKGFPEVNLLTGDARDFRPYFQGMLGQIEENLGIKIGLKQAPFAEVLERFRGEESDEKPDLWFVAWIADYADADNFLRVADWRDIGGWSNDDFQELVDRGQRTLDQDERMRLYEQAEELITQEAPIIPMLYARFHIVLKPWVVRFPASPKDVTNWKEVVIQPH